MLANGLLERSLRARLCLSAVGRDVVLAGRAQRRVLVSTELELRELRSLSPENERDRKQPCAESDRGPLGSSSSIPHFGTGAAPAERPTIGADQPNKRAASAHGRRRFMRPTRVWQSLWTEGRLATIEAENGMRPAVPSRPPLEPILALMSGTHVIVHTPTGSEKVVDCDGGALQRARRLTLSDLDFQATAGSRSSTAPCFAVPRSRNARAANASPIGSSRVRRSRRRCRGRRAASGRGNRDPRSCAALRARAARAWPRCASRETRSRTR